MSAENRKPGEKWGNVDGYTVQIGCHDCRHSDGWGNQKEVLTCGRRKDMAFCCHPAGKCNHWEGKR